MNPKHKTPFGSPKILPHTQMDHEDELQPEDLIRLRHKALGLGFMVCKTW